MAGWATHSVWGVVACDETAGDSGDATLSPHSTTVRELAALPFAFGGAVGIRTPDPHNAIVVLYQLSYDPIQSECQSSFLARIVKAIFGCGCFEGTPVFITCQLDWWPTPNTTRNQALAFPRQSGPRGDLKLPTWSIS